MTGCVLISPNQITAPLILGDTIVSMDGVEDPNLAPARLRGPMSTENPDYYLARKTFILSDRAAIGVAGNEEQIRDFLEYAAATVEACAAGERPMRALGDRADAFAGGVHVVGSYVLEPNKTNYVRPNAHGTIDLGGLGYCSAIGSGATDIMTALRQLDESLSPDIDGFMRAHRAGWSLQQRRLAEELWSTNYDPSWGGYVERIYFDPSKKKWVRQPRTLHLFYQANCDGERTLEEGLTRIIAYDPGEQWGCILCAFDAGNGLDLYIHGLKNLILPPDQARGPSPSIWSDWAPDIVSVTLTITIGTRAAHYWKSFPVEPSDSIYLSIDGRRFNGDFDSRKVQRVIDGFKRTFAAQPTIGTSSK